MLKLISMSNKSCLIYNYAQHYRLPIFKLLDTKLKVDSYFGDKMGDVKKLDYNELKHFKKELKNIKVFSVIYWQKGALNLLFKPYNCYIILGEYYCLSTWLILILNKFLRKKIILWTHGWYGNESFFKSIFKITFFKMSDQILLYGNYAKELMIRQGFKEKKLQVIYNSLDYENQLIVRKTLRSSDIYVDHFKNNYPVLIFIGRLTKLKKLNLLIEAQNQLINSGNPVNLIFIGKGEEEKKLKKLVDFRKTERFVWFFGPSYNEIEIGELIYNAEICVSPGNVGLTAMHAMVYGTPVISHDDFTLQMPEFESIVKGETGDFYENENINSLVLTIENWFKSNNDREYVRNKCFEKIDNYFNPMYQLKIIQKVLNE